MCNSTEQCLRRKIEAFTEKRTSENTLPPIDKFVSNSEMCYTEF